MIGGRWTQLTAALATTLVVTSCAQTSSGSPVPGATVSTSGGTDRPGSATSTETSAGRPRDIDLDGKDPCGLIPRDDWPKFGIEEPGERSEEPNLRSPHCFYSGAGDVTLVVTEGIEAWTDEDRNVEIEDAEPIEGFPSITMANNADRRACYAAVDVSDGQYLLTTATPDPDDPRLPEKCDLAYQLAESAMRTLVAS